MGAMSDLVLDERDDWSAAFFAPTSTDMIDGLVARYREARACIAEVAAFANGDMCASVIGYFFNGNATEDRGRTSMSASAAQTFQESGAVAALNAAYWSEALSLTDVYDAMPQDRRNQWNAQIRNPQGVKAPRLRSYEIDAGMVQKEWETEPLPAFEDETVRATLQGLLASRATFLAERVDGIFRALSGEHVTNSPAAFGKRMIIARLINGYGSTDHDRVGYINDLRCVIAKFMGRDESPWNSTSSVVDYARRSRRGEWVTLDGGALRLRAYKCGTAHLEVHQDMAWRLNCVLAHLYPMAIPPEFRTKPKKRQREFKMMGRPLPFAVVAALDSLETAYRLVENTGQDAWRNKYRRVEIKNAVQPRNGWGDSAAVDEVERVLSYLGGVKEKNDRGGHYYAFEYDPREVLGEVIASGCLPDQKAHQFYPTPVNVAAAAIDLAQIGPDHACLEPSAGTGGLADLMPMVQTFCVEISKLHCRILAAKGFEAEQADFLAWDAYGKRFDRIVMNPPFSEGRWQAHVEHAAAILADGGRLVAIVPASARGKYAVPGMNCEWAPVFRNQFAGTSIDVTILVATRS